MQKYIVYCVNSPYTLRHMFQSPTNLAVTATCQVINSAVQLLLRVSSSCLPLSHLIVGLDGAQLHHQLETQQVIGANGLKLQQFAQGHQLRPLQMLQRQLILKELGELHDVFSAGLFTSVPHLQVRRVSRRQNNFTICNMKKKWL